MKKTDGDFEKECSKRLPELFSDKEYLIFSWPAISGPYHIHYKEFPSISVDFLDKFVEERYKKGIFELIKERFTFNFTKKKPINTALYPDFGVIKKSDIKEVWVKREKIFPDKYKSIDDLIANKNDLFLTERHYWAIFDDDFNFEKIKKNKSHSRSTAHSIILQGQTGIRKIIDAKNKSKKNSINNYEIDKVKEDALFAGAEECYIISNSRPPQDEDKLIYIDERDAIYLYKVNKYKKPPIVSREKFEYEILFKIEELYNIYKKKGKQV